MCLLFVAASRISGASSTHPSAVGRYQQRFEANRRSCEEEVLLSGAKLAIEKLTKITSASADSVQQCFSLLESLDIQNTALTQQLSE